MRRRLLPVLACLSFAGFSPPAAAYYLPATPTYAVSRWIEVAAVAVNLPTGINNLAKLEASVKSECPHALAAGPRTAQRRDLEAEARWDVTLVATWPLREPVDGFAEAQIEDRLRWKNRPLNDAMYVYLHELLAYFRIRPTNLCRDIEQWAESGYAKLAAGTSAFLVQRGRFWKRSHPELVLVRNRLLPKTANSAERRLLQRAELKEGSQAETLVPKLDAAATEVESVLGAEPSGYVDPVVPTVPTVETEPA